MPQLGFGQHPKESRMLAAAVAASCVVAFWLLTLAIHFLVQDSAVDPLAGVVVGLLVAIPVYLRPRKR